MVCLFRKSYEVNSLEDYHKHGVVSASIFFSFISLSVLFIYAPGQQQESEKPFRIIYFLPFFGITYLKTHRHFYPEFAEVKYVSFICSICPHTVVNRSLVNIEKMTSYWHCCQWDLLSETKRQEPSRAVLLTEGNFATPYPGDIWQCLEILLVVLTGMRVWVLLASTGSRQRMMLNILQS